MWSAVFVVFLVIGGSTAFVFRNCGLQNCDKNKIIRLRPGTVPNEQQLKMYCGVVLERYDCIKNSIEECTEQDMETLSLSDNFTVAETTKMMLNMQRLAIDICDEDSLLRANYVSSVDCFNDFIKTPHPECHEEATGVYQAYAEAQKVLDTVKVPGQEARDAECLITAHTVACTTIALGEQCGEVARATMVELMRRVQYVSTAMSVCTKEQFEMLRTGYLGFMELEEPRKSYFTQAFEAGK